MSATICIEGESPFSSAVPKGRWAPWKPWWKLLEELPLFFLETLNSDQQLLPAKSYVLTDLLMFYPQDHFSLNCTRSCY